MPTLVIPTATTATTALETTILSIFSSYHPPLIIFYSEVIKMPVWPALQTPVLIIPTAAAETIATALVTTILSIFYITLLQ